MSPSGSGSTASDMTSDTTSSGVSSQTLSDTLSNTSSDTTSSNTVGSDSEAATNSESDTSIADLPGNDPPNPDGLGPAIVELGSENDLSAAGAYVLLAKTGITNVSGSTIMDGHVGLSPAAATFITGFSLVADPSNEFSTSVSVVSPGKVYAANYSSPTPSHLTTAVLAMEGAYTDAASRTSPDHLDLESGNLGGLTLEPGLYKWGSSVTIPVDVTISGNPKDIWIFQISDNLDISTGKSVLLSGGAAPEHIFWQVAGEVTIHANAHFEGVLLAKTAIIVQTNATMKGRALAQAMIAIDDNALTAP